MPLVPVILIPSPTFNSLTSFNSLTKHIIRAYRMSEYHVQTRSVTMKIRVKWTPPPSNDSDDPSNPIAVLASPSPEPFAPIPEIRSTLSLSLSLLR